MTKTQKCNQSVSYNIKPYSKATKLLASLMMVPLAFLGTPTSAFAAMAGGTPREENTTAIKDNNQTTDNSSTTNTDEDTDNSTSKQDTIAALSSQQKAELAQFEPNAAGNAIKSNDISTTQQNTTDSELASDDNDVVLDTEVVDASNFGADDTKLVEAPEIGSDTLLLLSTPANDTTNASDNTDEQENDNDNSSSENNNSTEDSEDTGDFFASIQSSIADFASSITGAPVMQASSSQQAEADGTKIEKITVKWVTKDDYTDGDDARLSQRWTDDNTNHTIQMRVNAALSGQHDYEVGDITLTIPKNIVKYRDGGDAGRMSLSVPEAPDTRATFAYADMGDTYVLTNTRKLSAASSLMFDFSISGITPHLLNGNPDEYVTDPFNAIISVITHKNNSISLTSNNITATFDTSENINNAYDRVENLNTKYPSSWPQELKPSNDGDFIYVEYYSYCSVNGNQSYSLSCTSEILDNARDWIISIINITIIWRIGMHGVCRKDCETQGRLELVSRKK